VYVYGFVVKNEISLAFCAYVLEMVWDGMLRVGKEVWEKADH